MQVAPANDSRRAGRLSFAKGAVRAHFLMDGDRSDEPAAIRTKAVLLIKFTHYGFGRAITPMNRIAGACAFKRRNRKGGGGVCPLLTSKKDQSSAVFIRTITDIYDSLGVEGEWVRRSGESVAANKSV